MNQTSLETLWDSDVLQELDKLNTLAQGVRIDQILESNPPQLDIIAQMMRQTEELYRTLGKLQDELKK